jgi:uncharacterized protein YhaN
MKFAIGDKVVEKKHLRPHTNYPVDEVVGFLGDHVLATGWGDGFGNELRKYDFSMSGEVGSRSFRSSIQRFVESELLTPEEAIEELAKLEAEKSKLESEFEDVRASVKEKLNQAARLVKEAGDLVKPTGKDFYDLVAEGEALYKALTGGGWSHSTMKCRYGR